MKRVIVLIMMVAPLLAFNQGCMGNDSDKGVKRPVVTDVDIVKYSGTWYEIARYPHKFEKDLVGVTATYNLLPKGKIEVINSGYKGTLDGEKSVARGKAYIPDSSEPGRLKVSFFLFFYADYLILELDEDYSYALIGSKSDDYLWILSRTPQLSEEVLTMLKDKAVSLGYDLSKLQMVPQRVD